MFLSRTHIGVGRRPELESLEIPFNLGMAVNNAKIRKTMAGAVKA